MKMDKKKTNAIRKLDQKNIKYIYHSFDVDPDNMPTGVEAAAIIHKNAKNVFKTLVTQGKSKEYYVFVIPVAMELNLKKAAKTSNEKSIAMIKSRELLSVTGYVHGGCSPIGMKKTFKTFVHSTVEDLDIIIFSAGKIGRQIEISAKDLSEVVDYVSCDIADEK